MVIPPEERKGSALEGDRQKEKETGFKTEKFQEVQL